MQLARVIGDVVSTLKDDGLQSLKLLVLQPLNADGRDTGKILVAVDAVGAGVGEKVFLCVEKKLVFRSIQQWCQQMLVLSALLITVPLSND